MEPQTPRTIFFPLRLPIGAKLIGGWFFYDTTLQLIILIFLSGKNRSMRKFLIELRNFDLLAVLMNLFEVIGMRSKIFQFGMKFFLNFLRNLVSSFRNSINSLVNI